MKSESRVTRRALMGASLGLFLVFTVFVQPALVCADGVSSDREASSSSAARGRNAWTCNCPDDYVRKPVPCVSPVACCCPDTYRPKPCLVLPCPTKCCCPDDYCSKPRPALCQPKAEAWYKCVPAVSYLWSPRAVRDPRAKSRDEACK